MGGSQGKEFGEMCDEECVRKDRRWGGGDYQREYHVQYDDLLRRSCHSHGAEDTPETYDLN